MPSYDAFAPFYDAVQGDGSERAAILRELIRRHNPSAQTVLEVACGTGSILKQLQSTFSVTGLDLSREMLDVAAEKVLGVRLIEADMTAFDLGERFDVVLCVYDSINHLPHFSQWEALFDRAWEHLNDRGIFIFDINTERQLADLAERPPVVNWFGEGHLLVMEVEPTETAGNVSWAIRVFEHQGDSNYLLHAENIQETSFPRRQIEDSLRERFRRVAAHDPRRKRPSPASSRLYFTASK